MEVVKPLVFKKGGKQRLGKGFSLDELKKAGLKPKLALKFGIPIDPRRRTLHEENIEKLKKLLEAKQREGAQKTEPKEKPEQKTEQKKKKTKRGKEGKNKT